MQLIAQKDNMLLFKFEDFYVVKLTKRDTVNKAISTMAWINKYAGRVKRYYVASKGDEIGEELLSSIPTNFKKYNLLILHL